MLPSTVPQKLYYKLQEQTASCLPLVQGPDITLPVRSESEAFTFITKLNNQSCISWCSTRLASIHSLSFFLGLNTSTITNDSYYNDGGDKDYNDDMRKDHQYC